MLDYEFYHVLSGIVAALSFGFSVSALLYFLLLRKVQKEDMSDGAQIPRFICSLSLTIALLEFLYLLISTLLHKEFFASVAWPVVFFGTLISLFYLLPFAYFIIESVGLRIFFTHQTAPPRLHKKERRVFFAREDLFSQLAEALLNSALFAVVLFGIVILVGLIPFARQQQHPLPHPHPPLSSSSSSSLSSTLEEPLFCSAVLSSSSPTSSIFSSLSLSSSSASTCSLSDPVNNHQQQPSDSNPDRSWSGLVVYVLGSSSDVLSAVWDYLGLAYYVVMHGSALLFAAVSPAGINRLSSFLRHTVRLPSLLQRVLSLLHSSTTAYTVCCTAIHLASLSFFFLPFSFSFSFPFSFPFPLVDVDVDLCPSDYAVWRLVVNVVRLLDTLSLAQYWVCSLVGLYQFRVTLAALQHNTIPSMIYTTALVVLISTSMPAATASLGLPSKSFSDMGFMAPFATRYNSRLCHSAAGAVFIASYLFNNDDLWHN